MNTTYNKTKGEIILDKLIIAYFLIKTPIMVLLIFGGSLWGPGSRFIDINQLGNLQT